MKTKLALIAGLLFAATVATTQTNEYITLPPGGLGDYISNPTNWVYSVTNMFTTNIVVPEAIELNEDWNGTITIGTDVFRVVRTTNRVEVVSFTFVDGTLQGNHPTNTYGQKMSLKQAAALQNVAYPAFRKRFHESK